MASSSILIAFCGIDGAGKSTILDLLKQRGAAQNAAYFRKTDRRNSNILENMFPEDQLLTASGTPTTFGSAMARASLLDFVRYYETDIRNQATHNVSFLDRWTPCVQAYSGEVLGAQDLVSFSLRTIPPPDIVFYIDVEPKVAWDRIAASRIPKRDESIDVLQRFQVGYEKVLAGINCPVRRILNHSLEQSLASIETELTILLQRDR